MNQKIIKYNKKSNYLFASLIFLLILMAYVFQDIRVGTYFETILLFISVGIFWVILNSNLMFSFTSGKYRNYIIGSGELKKYQIKTLESNYYIYLFISFSFLLFVISYLLLKYSKLIYSIIPPIFVIILLFVMAYHIRNKKKIIAKTKQINAEIQDTILINFCGPIWAYYMFFNFLFPHLSSNSRLYGIIVIGFYSIISFHKGIIRIIKIKK